MVEYISIENQIECSFAKMILSWMVENDPKSLLVAALQKSIQTFLNNEKAH